MQLLYFKSSKWCRRDILTISLIRYAMIDDVARVIPFIYGNAAYIISTDRFYRWSHGFAFQASELQRISLSHASGWQGINNGDQKTINSWCFVQTDKYRAYELFLYLCNVLKWNIFLIYNSSFKTGRKKYVFIPWIDGMMMVNLMEWYGGQLVR